MKLFYIISAFLFAWLMTAVGLFLVAWSANQFLFVSLLKQEPMELWLLVTCAVIGSLAVLIVWLRGER